MAITAISKKSKAAKQVAKALILIVEDDALQAEILKDHLESSTENSTVLKFSSGEECLKQIGKKKPTIAFIDYNLNSKNKKGINRDNQGKHHTKQQASYHLTCDACHR